MKTFIIGMLLGGIFTVGLIDARLARMEKNLFVVSEALSSRPRSKAVQRDSFRKRIDRQSEEEIF